MKKLIIGRTEIVALSLVASFAPTAVAQSPVEEIDLKHCRDAVQVMKVDGKKLPTIIVALDDEAKFVSALFLHKAEKECYKALPTKPDGPSLKFYQPVGELIRIQPFVYFQAPGSMYHFLGYDSAGNAIWYKHQH